MSLLVFLRAQHHDIDLLWIGVGQPTTLIESVRKQSPIPVTLLGAVEMTSMREVESLVAGWRDRHSHGGWYKAALEIIEYVDKSSLDPKDLLPAKRMLTLAEAARMMNCSPATVRRRVAAGEIAVVQIGRQLRFDPDELGKGPQR